MNGSHRYLRETYKWGTYGKSGNDPLKWVILKDIHDDHLQNIITMVQQFPRHYGPNILMVMLAEQEFRRIKKIKVPFKFG